ncbi:hypothetical protein C1A_400 [Wolbachia endosymbiont of Culex quinquefasciatus JHB]|uniref:hypothetical protein n=1 Tax=unclassified Wolbachia TaxID=2640676 RepID=UPI0001761EA1|nr:MULTISPECIES: hypothetical protein [unclassified Wolbachia]EEB56218.1 hypothetical protein C1A_400 [Wolbachia endosymbiont of Culex quinquefasciatus JHB]CAQ54936.1 Hypothetical protein WP0828 [Wolbachia endosymbiont of Culex quinquefasciatus Pel]CQD09437.1 Uncharacterised protein [Wolbachia endosymbiont wPip_Mol of Culex molestus]
MTTIWKLKNIAPITKMSIESTVATASLAAAITTLLIATKVIAGPASLALIASPAGIAVLFIAAVYFAAAAYASYQQMHKNEEIGVNVKDTDFFVLLGDMVKSGEVVEENQKLNLKLSKDDYEALTNGKNVGDEVTLNVLLKNKSVEVKFKHVAVANDNDNYKLELISVDGEVQLAEMKERLAMAPDSKSLTVAVGDKDLEALKNEVQAKLAEVAVNAALSKIAQK